MPLIHANGVEIHYHLQGKGTPIVFLHPPCIASRVFTYIRNDLSQDHKTLLFDFRGHGRSGSSEAPITIPLLAEDVRRLLDALNISKAYLCTYSLGSMVGLHALLTYPDRFFGGIFLGGLAEASGWKTRAKLKAGIWASKLKARELISLPSLWVHADNHETFYRLRGETRAGDIAKWREYMTSGLSYSAVGRLKDVRQPVLLLCGEKDTEFKGYMDVMQKGLPNDSSAYIPGVKHTLPIYGAGSIGELIRGWVGAERQHEDSDADSSYSIRSDEMTPAGKIPIADQDYEVQEPYYH
ncbi:alpha/beta fold hydrolase [Cohnella silvisoli]|uniref:Alpha/beta hydrolase n=1 Tax=Cohnella silvisoli TaxID=2873699 RepID=A0ABV1KWH6_9BACL|nr:alpha/beta hydrolase [Cohnella silvisoli]MCD9023964.1 alpha/beta hydrolase [Cohnella silvisoli]